MQRLGDCNARCLDTTVDDRSLSPTTLDCWWCCCWPPSSVDLMLLRIDWKNLLELPFGGEQRRRPGGVKPWWAVMVMASRMQWWWHKGGRHGGGSWFFLHRGHNDGSHNRRTTGQEGRGTRLLYSPRIRRPRGVESEQRVAMFVAKGVGGGDGERRKMKFPTMF